MKKKKMSLFDICNVAFMMLVLFVTIYPLYYTIIASFSDPKAVAGGEVVWLPVRTTLESYKHVFANKQIWIGYANTILYTVCGTTFNIVLTIPAAYVMSKKYLPYRSWFMLIFLFTMYFSGGTVPTYMLVKNLNLLNTRLVLMIMGGVSVYNLIVARSYFSTSVPESLYEAAEIDGAGEFKRFASIAIPLAKPIIAVLVLYYAVTHWNNYFNALLYVSNPDLVPLQSVLRSILIQNQNALDEALLIENLSKEQLLDKARRYNLAYTMKYAVVFIASAPLLVAYPFVQKYFVKGALIGSVKE